MGRLAVECKGCGKKYTRHHIVDWQGFCHPCSNHNRRGKPLPNRKGKKAGPEHWNWQGGITAPNDRDRVKFKRSTLKKVLVRDDYTCQVCSQRGGYLQVDHIKSWKDYPQLRFDLDNCRTLCMACHYYVTFKRKLPSGVLWGHTFGRRMTS